MTLTVSGVQRVNNQSRDKRRTANKDKNKKPDTFGKILAEEITVTAAKQTTGR